MPFDLTFDSGLIILIAAFDLFLLIRFFQFRRQIKVRGMVPGRLIMLGIVCAVVVIQACRGAFTQYTLAFNICTVLAVLLVTEARHRLRSKAIPEAFRGLPITLVYVGVLALAIYGFTGHSVIL